ncbi:hypothetical protein BGZ98_010376 [Dissophora globulifera]|nr:hypothetical protein BGZ98_010376 [Dissophora globulifera]
MPSPGEDSTSTASSNGTSSSNSNTLTGPLQTLNSSLKRIRLNEGDQESIRRSDSIEEWGTLDLTDLDESEPVLEVESPTAKKARKESDNTQDDIEDMDDFMPSEQQSETKTRTEENDRTLSEVSSSSWIATPVAPLPTASTPFKSHTNTMHRSKTSKSSKPTRSLNGVEDVFSHDQVRSWSEVRIKTWDHRRTNTEGFYYRFVDPTEGQQNGPWSQKSTREFMERLEEWKAKGIRIGTSWGVFSMRVSNKAGYQCSSYYRKLLESKKLTDPAYAWEGGKLIMVNKSSGGEMAISNLSERWETEEVKAIEANVDRWIKEYHSNIGSTTEAPRVKATTAPAIPKAMSIRPSKQQQPADEGDLIPVVDISDKLAEYSSFMRKSTSSEPGRIRQSISLIVPGTVISSSSPPARAVVPIEVRKTPLAASAVKGQTGLSLFWKNIRPVRVECPDVPKYIIPKDVELRPTWAHKIQSFADMNAVPVEGAIYKEVSRMLDFDWTSISEGFEESICDIQGVLADPPWNFIVEDGRNDGACRLTLQEFGDIMEKALQLMPNGIVSIWTHKAILPEVVGIMHGLGCRYVENLVWYKMALNNSNLNRASPYFRTSKEILLMFKKGDGFDIRHQRTADVIMDFEKPTTAWIKEDYTEPKPESTFEMMEIMLPDARYTPESGRGRLLEIWAKKSQERRPGWFSIHELKSGERAPDNISSAPVSIKALTAVVGANVDVGADILEVAEDIQKEVELDRETKPESDDDIDSLDEAILAEVVNDMDLDLNE